MMALSWRSRNVTICDRIEEAWTSIKPATLTVVAQWVLLAVLMNMAA